MIKETAGQKLKALRSGWYIWLFPSFALAISLWLFYEYWLQRGPHIKIYFDDGAQIQPERTRITFRGVTVGKVNKVTISDDKKRVVADVILYKEAEDFAVEGSRFWLVAPKVSLQGVSGLETLIEGTYIAVQPGKSSDKPKLEFTGKMGSESKDSLEDTTAYYLETRDLGSVSSGDAVTFRGVKIGSVTKETLSSTGQTVILQINIQNKYVRVIRSNSIFWRTSGIRAQLGLLKSELKIEALETLLHGGIEVSTPEPASEIAKAQAKFTLFVQAPKNSDKWNAILE